MVSIIYSTTLHQCMKHNLDKWWHFIHCLLGVTGNPCYFTRLTLHCPKECAQLQAKAQKCTEIVLILKNNYFHTLFSHVRICVNFFQPAKQHSLAHQYIIWVTYLGRLPKHVTGLATSKMLLCQKRLVFNKYIRVGNLKLQQHCPGERLVHLQAVVLHNKQCDCQDKNVNKSTWFFSSFQSAQQCCMRVQGNLFTIVTLDLTLF